MKRTWAIIGVRDVAGSFKWYQSLFGQPETPPAHDHFGQILDTDGTVLLCLHQWGAHEHPTLMSPREAPPGNGLLLFFRVDDFDMAQKRARALVTRFEEEPHVNPNTQTGEFSLRDPDGYYVTISAIEDAPQRSKRDDISIPTLPSRSMNDTLAFYRRLGFDGEILGVGDSYAILRRGALELHFFIHDDLRPAESSAGCYIRVSDVESIYEAFAAAKLPRRGIPRQDALEDKAWGMREFAIVDPDGNLLRIGQTLRQ